MMDVYYKVDKYLIEKDFYGVSEEKQKELIEEGLKDYVIRKIRERDRAKGNNLLQKKEEISLDDLVTILGELIPKEEHNDTIRHLTHYILNVAGGMQGFSITWWEEKDPDLIQNPVIQFNAAGKWDSLTTHRDTSYVQIFHFTHQTFREEFNKKDKENKSLILKAKTMSLPAKSDKDEQN